MRKCVLVSVILILVFIFGTYNSCLATKYDITSNDFKNEWNPTATNQGYLVNNGADKPITDLIVFIVNKVLGLIQMVSGILMVVCITFTGFKMILGSNPDVANEIGIDVFGESGKNPEVKKRVLDNIRRLLIGSIFAFSSTTLVRIAFDLFTGF